MSFGERLGSGTDGRKAGGGDCKAGEYCLVSADGRGAAGVGRGLASLTWKSLPYSRVFCLEIHLPLIENQQIIFVLLMEAVLFLVPRVPGLYVRGLEVT